MPSPDHGRCPECAFSWATDVEDAIAMVAESPRLFASALEVVDPAAPVRPGAWSPTEYIWHLVDVLRIGTERLWTLTDDAGAGVVPWDENDLARVRGYSDLSPVVGLRAYGRAVDDWVAAAREAPPDARTPHTELGTISTVEVVRRNAHEAQHHLLDIEQAVDQGAGTVHGARSRARSDDRLHRAGGTPHLFDDYVMVDWSANSTPRTGKDSIWIGTGVWQHGRFVLNVPTNPPTRHAAVAEIGKLIDKSLEAGRRAVIGFDFPLSYPAGLVESFPATFGQGQPWRAIWHTLSELIHDAPDNANNRWEVARALNRETGCRLFWGCPDAQADDYLAINDKGLPALRERGRRPDRFRLTELRAHGAGGAVQSVWKLAYAGSVGSQSLLGIPHLEALRARYDGRLRVWPFETGIAASQITVDVPVTVVEIWPTVFAPDLGRHPVRDAAQVLQAVQSCAQADDDGILVEWLSPSAAAGMDEQVAEEGWILGVT